MPQKRKVAPTYRSLVKTLRDEIMHARRQVEQRLVLSYWTRGRPVSEFQDG